jgi:hypothetical protein
MFSDVSGVRLLGLADFGAASTQVDPAVAARKGRGDNTAS